jgi:hypothetical protein
MAVTITDGKFCKIREEFIINEPLLLELSRCLQPLDCLNANTGSINLVVTGGMPPFNFLV